MAKQPNIILIITDQQRSDTIAGLGAPWMITPNLDRLAAEGMAFTNCYTTSPLCVPSRASLFRGMYPHGTGIVMNFQEWQPTWVQSLSDAGYHCVNIGKMHTNPYDAPAGFHQRIIVENKDRPMFLEEHERAFYDDWDLALHARGITKPTRYHRFAANPQQFREALGAFVWEYDEDMHPDAFVGNTARWWVEERQSDAPLFLQIGFAGPHPPFDPSARALKMYEGRKIPLPEVTQEELAKQPSPHQELRRNMVRANFDCVAWQENPAPEALERMRRHYAANVTMIDEKVGEVLAVLGQRGYLDHAIVIYTSDHGEALGDHGHIQKWTMYDTSVKVPLICWSSDDQIGHGVRSDALVQLMDLAPTILEYAGVAVPANWNARSLRGLMADPQSTPPRDMVHSELFRDHMQTGAELIIMQRDRRWKVVWYLDSEEGELYDLENDPKEVKNLWDSEEHAALRTRLSAQVQNWLIRNTVLGHLPPKSRPQPPMPID